MPGKMCIRDRILPLQRLSPCGGELVLSLSILHLGVALPLATTTESTKETAELTAVTTRGCQLGMVGNAVQDV